MIEEALEGLLFEKDELVAEMQLDVAAVAVEGVFALRHARPLNASILYERSPHDALLSQLAMTYSPSGPGRLWSFLRQRSGRLTLPHGLTAAERTVAVAVLEGQSNAQIATARQPSVRTVANQVASLFRKLRVASRSEAVAALGRLQRS